MATVTFDTLAYTKKLKAAGFDDRQAEALSEAQRESFAEIIDDRLATNKDLKEVEASLKSDIGRLESGQIRLEGEIKLIKWMMGFVLAGIAALILKTFFS